MGQKTKTLIYNLERLISILESVNERNWTKWASNSKMRIENSDYSGIENILSAYGGMGSFSDLIIQPKNLGTSGFSDREVELNNELDKLKLNIWDLAQYIKHDQE